MLEAMSADLPVVTSDIAVFREYLTDHDTAILTRAADPHSLAAGMREMVLDGVLRDRLVTAGRALARTFSWQLAALEHIGLYGVVGAGTGVDRRSAQRGTLREVCDGQSGQVSRIETVE